MGPGIIMLQDKSFLLLWPHSGSLSLQLSQCCRGDCSTRFQEILKDNPTPIPKDGAHHFTCWGLCLELFLWRGICMSPIHGLPVWLQLIAVTTHLITSNEVTQETVTFKLALVLSAPVWTFMGPIWHKLCDIPTLPHHRFQRTDPVLNSIHSSLVVICWFMQMSWLRHSSFHCLTAVHSCPECGLSFTHHLTVLTSIVWSPWMFNKHQWMSMSASLSPLGNSILYLCFTHSTMSDAIVSDCLSAAICHMATKCNEISEGKLHLYSHTTSIHICSIK